MIRVLVADDQRINRVLLSGGLDSSRYEVVEAEDGQEALEKFDAHKPDVVLLDVMMPRMDGFEATRAIKQRIGQDHVPVILVTSLTDEKSLSQGMEAGADDFIPKPFNRVVLESKMKAALRIRNLFQTLNKNREELKTLHEQSHREQIMAAKLMAGALQTLALDSSMFRYRSNPMDIFNGDLLMAAKLGPGKTRILLGDFAGHGLAAAIGCLPVAMDFEQLCQSGVDLTTFARTANSALRGVLPRDRFLAAAIVDIDLMGRTIDIINAGMPTIYVRQAGGGIREKIGSTHLPFSILDDILDEQPITRINIECGDRLYLYSDGITEALNEAGEEYGEVRFENLVATSDVADENIFTNILSDSDEFVGSAPAEDDVTLLEIFPEAVAIEDSATAPDVKSTLVAPPVVRLKLDLRPSMLRIADLSHTLESILQSFEILEGHRASVFAILTELLNNSVDHGLLRLDSKLKHSIEGFAEFYEERQKRLEVLEEGMVSLEFALSNESINTWTMRIEVRDTGPGFDINKRVVNEGVAHGRGIMMVEGLCESVKYFEPGNRVQATYKWEVPPS